jgi:FemAB-related protein (PEP-CTERM system-associated)
MLQSDVTTALRVAPLEVCMDQWDSYVTSHEKATFFHQLGWHRVLSTTFGWDCHSCAVTREGRIRGILPLYRTRTLPLGHALVSLPLAVYGGICADDPEAEQALLAHARQLARSQRVRYLELRNQTELDGLLVKDLYATFRKEIASDAEQNMASIPRNQRRMVRIGERSDLESRLGGGELLRDFYHVYSSSVRHLGTPVFPYALFENLLREFDHACRILGIFRGGQMVAGVMTFFYRDQVMPYYAGSLRDAVRYAVNDLMYWRLLCYGAEHGYRIFDFGRSKKGSGAYDFKRHWGFLPTPLPYQYDLVQQQTIPDLSPNNPRFSLGIQLWRRLPLRLTQWIGPRLSRFFA